MSDKKEIKYDHSMMSDKTLEGIQNEVSKGLAVMAFYMTASHGIPLESFEEMLLEGTGGSMAESLHLYMSFRNDHPELFIK